MLLINIIGGVLIVKWSIINIAKGADYSLTIGIINCYYCFIIHTCNMGWLMVKLSVIDYFLLIMPFILPISMNCYD